MPSSKPISKERKNRKKSVDDTQVQAKREKRKQAVVRKEGKARPVREAARAGRVASRATFAPNANAVRTDRNEQYSRQWDSWSSLTTRVLSWSVQYKSEFEGCSAWIERLIAGETEYCTDADPTNKDWNGLIPKNTPTCKMATSVPTYLTPAGRSFLNHRRDHLASAYTVVPDYLKPLKAGDVLGVDLAIEQEMLDALAAWPTPLDPDLLTLGYPGIEHGVPFYLIGESPSQRCLHGDGQHYWGSRFYELIESCIMHHSMLTPRQASHSRQYIMLIILEAFSGVGTYHPAATCKTFLSDVCKVMSGTMELMEVRSPFRPLVSPKQYPRPDGYTMNEHSLDMYDIRIPKPKAGTSNAVLEAMIARQYAVLPWIESSAGVQMTFATRSNMTYDRCSWYLGSLYLVTKCGPDISSDQTIRAMGRDGLSHKFEQIGIDYQAYMLDVLASCYYAGGNLAKKIKGATDDLLRLLPIPRVSTTSPVDPWNETGFDVSHVGEAGRFQLNGYNVMTELYVPSLDDVLAPYIEHPDGEDQWPLAVEKCEKFGLRTLVDFASRIRKDPKGVYGHCVGVRTAMFLNEPISALGILYSSHILPLLKQPLTWDKPSINPELESAVPLFSAMMDDIIKNACLEAKLQTVHDLLRETLKAMNTDKSSGGYKVVFEFAESIADELGKTSSKKSRKVHTTGKAPTQAYLLNRLFTAGYMFHHGSHSMPNAIGRRDVTGGRTARMMYMISTGVQICQQYWYKGMGTHMTHIFTSPDGTSILPTAYTPELKHQTESEKMLAGHCCSVRSEVHNNKRITLTACFDYATMDQNSAESVRLMYAACLRSNDQSTIRIPREGVTMTDELTDENSDLMRVVDVMRKSLEAACNGIFTEKEDGSPGFKGVTRLGGHKLYGKRPTIFLDFNPSGQLITSRMNCATNVSAFPTHTRAWGDDGFNENDAADFSRIFRNRINRAATLGQTLVYNDCQIGCDIIFLKVRITGFTSFRRMKSIAKERADDPPAPTGVTAHLSSLYETSSRIRNDVEMVMWIRHMLRTASTFNGYGWSVPAPPLWAISGGTLPRIGGVLPISHSPVAFAAHADLLLDMYAALGFPLDLKDGLVLSTLGLDDEVGERIANWMVGMGDPPQVVGSEPPMTVKVRGLLPEGDLKPTFLTVENPVAVARDNLRGITDRAKGTASSDMLQTVISQYPIVRAQQLQQRFPTMPYAEALSTAMQGASRTTRLYSEAAYINSYAAQTAKVLAATISDNLSAKAVASNLALGVTRMASTSLPVSPALLDGGTGSISHDSVYVHTFSDVNYTYSRCGSVRLTMSSPLQGSLARTYGESRLEFLEYDGLYTPMFSLSRGFIEELMCACFGMHRDNTDKRTSMLNLLVPGRGDIQPSRILELLKTLSVTSLQALLQCGELPAGYDDLPFMREMLELETCGSMRMTGVMLDVGHEVVRHQIRHSISAATADILEHNMCEHLLAYHATVWSMMYTTSIITRSPIFEYPLFTCVRTHNWN